VGINVVASTAKWARGNIPGGVVLVFFSGLLMSCSTTDSAERRGASQDSTAELAFLNLAAPVVGQDVWEVVLCEIPENIADTNFAPLPDRLSVSTSDIVTAIGPVGEYFERWSGGRYAMTFIPGGTVAIDAEEDAQTCVESALESSSQGATGVVVIADAAHRDDVAGGWAQPGLGCANPDQKCSAQSSRRAVYLGGADFFTLSRREDPSSVPLDLLEHEIGHVLGWPHSSRTDESLSSERSPVGRLRVQGYDSSLDIMSNSAAPRELNPLRQHGPGVLGIHRLIAGWLELGDVQVIRSISAEATRFTLVPSDAGEVSSSPLLLVIDLGGNTAVTIEFIMNRGDNDHLMGSGIAVHRVEWGTEVCDVPGSDNLCLGVDRRVTLLGDSPDGRLGVGQLVTVGEFTMAVTTINSSGATPTAEIAVWGN
jgi:hypothetical protein